MKCRVYPKTDFIRSVLETRINEAEHVMKANNKDLTRLKGGGLHLPGQAEYLESANQVAQKEIERLELQLKLLDSHNCPEVSVEIEL